jgi:hypothetical protein
MIYLLYIYNGKMNTGGAMDFGPTESSVIRTKIIRLCDAYDFPLEEWPINTDNVKELRILLMTLEEIINEMSWDS